MFFSNDLLGRKSALGAVWIAAHGKRLNKAKLLQVNIGETCNRIMDPEVPQALRLQAILVGGVVIVYSRQQALLLDDCRDMLARLKASAADASTVTLREGRHQQHGDAITLPANADVLAAAAAAVPGVDLFPAFPAELLAGVTVGGARLRLQLGDDVLPVASLPGSASLQLPGQPQQARAPPAVFLDQAGCQPVMDLMELEDLSRYDLHLGDPETFAVPDAVAPGLDELLPPAHPRVTTAPAHSEGALPPTLAAAFDAPDDCVHPVQQRVRGSSEGQTRSTTPQATEQGARRRALRRRGAARRQPPLLDGLESMQIRGREYREWMQDRSQVVLAPHGRVPAPSDGSRGAGAALLRTPPAFELTAPVTALCPGGGWPPELLSLFTRHASLLAAVAGQGMTHGGGGATPSKKRTHAAQEASAAGLLPIEEQLGQQRSGPGFVADDALLALPEMEALDGGALPASPAYAAVRMHAADTLVLEGDEELDLETERLRAALNTTTTTSARGGSRELLFQLGLTPVSGDGRLGGSVSARGGGARRASSLLLRPEALDGGALSERSSGHARRELLGRDGIMGGGARSGGEDLGALLPALGEEEQLEAGRLQSSNKQLRPALGGEVTQDGLTQFQLLEASGPTQVMGDDAALGIGAAEGIGANTLALISLLRTKLEAQQSGGALPALSLFGLSVRLGRSEACRLFYQLLVTRSHNFISAEQTKPFGDIRLTPGPGL